MHLKQIVGVSVDDGLSITFSPQRIDNISLNGSCWTIEDLFSSKSYSEVHGNVIERPEFGYVDNVDLLRNCSELCGLPSCFYLVSEGHSFNCRLLLSLKLNGIHPNDSQEEPKGIRQHLSCLDLSPDCLYVVLSFPQLLLQCRLPLK